MTDYIPRDIAFYVEEALSSMPVVVLTGMRQTGKTTFLTRDKALKDRRYITLDDFPQLEAARQNPEMLIEGEAPITIDEAQKCPELLTAVKRAVDENRKNGQFLLSGSANFALLKDVSESLAGRAVYLSLQPFSRRELQTATGKEPFLPRFFEKPDILESETCAALRPEEILLGGMPPVCLGQAKSPQLWFNGFEQTYIERDLRSLSQVADLVAFRRLMQLAALRTGQILNQTDLGRDAHLNAETTRRYLGLLETSFILSRLPAYRGNRSSRLIKAPKILLADSGLVSYLARVTDLTPGAGDPLRGPLFETYLAQNLKSIVAAHWPGAKLYYWAVSGRYEVDFVIEDGLDSIAIETKAATRWNKSDLSGLVAFLASTKRCRAAILAHNGTQKVKLGDRLWALPLATIIS